MSIRSGSFSSCCRVALPALLLAVAFLDIGPAPAGAPDLKYPPMALGETLVYKVTEKGVGKSLIPATKVDLAEHSFRDMRKPDGSRYILHTCRERRKDKGVNEWTFHYSKTASGPRSENFVFEKLSPDGEIYYHEEYVFSNGFIKIPEATIHMMSVPYLLSGMSFDKKPRLSMFTWAQEGHPTKINVSVCGDEAITTPLKTVDTYKVCVEVDKKEVIEPLGAMGKIVAQMLPEFTIWFEKAPPHRPYRIHGVFGPLTPEKPEYTQELVAIKPLK